MLDADDADQAIRHGADGIVVSNHGGRQVDGAGASLDALPEVIARVAGRVPVLFDSGIPSGADAFKAVALGARAVLVGRPFVYGLALAGELDLALALSGHSNLANLAPDHLRPA